MRGGRLRAEVAVCHAGGKCTVFPDGLFDANLGIPLGIDEATKRLSHMVQRSSEIDHFPGTAQGSLVVKLPLGDDQRGTARQGLGNRNALPLSAAQLVRVRLEDPVGGRQAG